jgi:Tyrosyl-DNA phosphodiesterase
MTDIYPQNVKTKEVYRQSINLDKYDFSTANAHLIASVNGRFNGDNLKKYGQNRFGDLCKDSINSEDKVLTYQTSSVGKLNPKFLQSLK